MLPPAPDPVAKPQAAASETLAPYLWISHQLAGHLDFHSAIAAVAERIGRMVPYDHMDVCIITPSGGFHSAYEQGIATSWGADRNMSLTTSPLRRLLMGQCHEMVVQDATIDPEFHYEGCDNGPILRHSLRARLHVALRIHGQVIGCLSLSRKVAGVYGACDLEKVRIIAGLLAPYFFALRETDEARRLAVTEAQARAREEGLRLGALRLTDALEADRRRIAMDLHDHTLGDMTRLVRRLDSLSQNETLSGAMLDPVRKSLRQTMDGLRELIETVRPSALELFGLGDAIHAHLDRAIADSGVTIATSVSIDLPEDMSWLSMGDQMALFRIAQEAINNAIRHGGPRQIWVDLRQDADLFTLEISDDGHGPVAQDKDPARSILGKSRGRGLGNMRTRARLMGASFQFGRKAGRTRITVTRAVAEPEVFDENIDR